MCSFCGWALAYNRAESEKHRQQGHALVARKKVEKRES